MTQSVHKIIEDGGEQYLGWALAQERRLRRIGPAASAKHSFDDADVTVRVIGRQSYIHIKGKEDGHGYYFFPRSDAYPNGDNQTDTVPPAAQSPYGVLTEKFKAIPNHPETELGEFDWVGEVGGKKYVVTLPHTGSRYKKSDFIWTTLGSTYFVSKEKYTTTLPPILGLAVCAGNDETQEKIHHIAACYNENDSTTEIWARIGGEWVKRSTVNERAVSRVYFNKSGSKLCFMSKKGSPLVGAVIEVTLSDVGASASASVVAQSETLSTVTGNMALLVDTSTEIAEYTFIPGSPSYHFWRLGVTTSVTWSPGVYEGRKRDIVVACDYSHNGSIVVGRIKSLNAAQKVLNSGTLTFYKEYGFLISDDNLQSAGISKDDYINDKINTTKDGYPQKLPISGRWSDLPYYNNNWSTSPATAGPAVQVSYEDYGTTSIVHVDGIEVCDVEGASIEKIVASIGSGAGLGTGKLYGQPDGYSNHTFGEIYGAARGVVEVADLRYGLYVVSKYKYGNEKLTGNTWAQDESKYGLDSIIAGNVGEMSSIVYAHHSTASNPPGFLNEQNIDASGFPQRGSNFSTIKPGSHGLIAVNLVDVLQWIEDETGDEPEFSGQIAAGGLDVAEIVNEEYRQYGESRLTKYKALTGSGKRIDTIKIF